MKPTYPLQKMIGRHAGTMFALVLFTMTTLTAGAQEIPETRDTGPVRPSKARTGFRFAQHLLKSHTVDLVRAPVSSARDLASLTYRSGDAWIKRIDIRFRATPQLNMKPIPALTEQSSMDLKAWEAWLDDHTAIPETGGSIEFLVDGESYFERLNHAIIHAEESISLQTYIFDNDDVATNTADLLKFRSEEVDVRVLYDGLGTIMSHHAPAPSQVESYRGPRSIHEYLAQAPRLGVRRTHNRWLMGDHTKSTIVDRKVAFVGGMNIGREYRHDWHDLMVELRGPVVEILEGRFDSSWARANRGDWEALTQMFRKKKPATDVASGMRLLLTTPTRKEIANTQLEAIRRAKNFVCIQNAYFADDEFVHELCKARKRGVDVRVIIPGQSDHDFMHASNKVSINRLIKNGVRVYDYPEMSHVKAAIFDGWVCFGTANYDKLSLAVNRELNIASSDPDVAQRLMDCLFIPDMEKSTEFTEQHDLTFRDHLVELLADEG